MPISSAEVQYRNGYEYGMGVVASTGMRANLMAEGAVTGFQNAEGGLGELKIIRIEATSDLEDALNVSASASAGIGLFSASARFDFAKSCQVHSHSMNLLVAHKCQFGFEQIDNPTLTGPAREVINRPEVFQQRYGELFCAGFATGGLFFGVLQIEYTSEQSKQSIDAAISGSYGLAFSVEASMRLQQALAQTRSSVSVQMYNEGGSLRGHTRPMTPEELLAAHAAWFGSLVGEDGRGTALRKPYQALVLPASICEGPMPPNAQDLETQRAVLVRCALLRSQTLDLLNTLSYLTLKPDRFEFGPSTLSTNEVSALRSQVAGDLAQINRAASNAINDPAKATDPENIPTQGAYTFAAIPSDRLPRPKGADLTQVPNLSGISTAEAAQQKITEARLKLHIVENTTAAEGAFAVLQQSPPAGFSVPTDSLVTIIIPKLKATELWKWRVERQAYVKMALNLETRRLNR